MTAAQTYAGVDVQELTQATAKPKEDHAQRESRMASQQVALVGFILGMFGLFSLLEDIFVEKACGVAGGCSQTVKVPLNFFRARVMDGALGD